ncbi:hypothetical protein HPB50_025098 [Hyalomma asiaticum]|uniref:Uncharacterized protein n=1 Tax=Hyalomma asiaticum TaxID=266040 RepID=A0ACB7STC0_HYAAI|nr:hypothetical protein HPB50_025098 [Hyalomma asiaticum]
MASGHRKAPGWSAEGCLRRHARTSIILGGDHDGTRPSERGMETLDRQSGNERPVHLPSKRIPLSAADLQWLQRASVVAKTAAPQLARGHSLALRGFYYSLRSRLERAR